MSNDIYNAWRSIWRITNQVVPYWRNTRPGAFPDMDMLLYVRSQPPSTPYPPTNPSQRRP